MSNYSILQQNTLAGLSETAGHLYLRLCDQFEAHGDRAGERRAFFEACRYEERCGSLVELAFREMPQIVAVDGMVPGLGKVDPVEHSRTVSDLAGFFAERWRHNFVERAV